MNLFRLNKGQVQLLSHLTYFLLSYCPLQNSSFPDFFLLSFVILTWNLVYEFILTLYRSSLTFPICYNLVFRTFLCCLLKYWHQIVGMNLYWVWHNTGRLWLLYPFWVMSLWNFLGQVGDIYCLSNTYRMLVLNKHLKQ